MKVINKFTYPNGKIYLEKDLADTLGHFPSVNNELIEKDYPKTDRALRRSFAVVKEIVWESPDATDAEVNSKEVELIWAHRSNDPTVGYNQWPKFEPPKK